MAKGQGWGARITFQSDGRSGFSNYLHNAHPHHAAALKRGCFVVAVTLVYMCLGEIFSFRFLFCFVFLFFLFAFFFFNNCYHTVFEEKTYYKAKQTNKKSSLGITNTHLSFK